MLILSHHVNFSSPLARRLYCASLAVLCNGMPHPVNGWQKFWLNKALLCRFLAGKNASGRMNLWQSHRPCLGKKPLLLPPELGLYRLAHSRF